MLADKNNLNDNQLGDEPDFANYLGRFTYPNCGNFYWAEEPCKDGCCLFRENHSIKVPTATPTPV